MEVTPGFEPGNEGFADPCLTTWLCHRTVSPLVSILYETAFVKRETVFPAAFLLSASTDGGDAGKAPSRRTALLFSENRYSMEMLELLGSFLAALGTLICRMPLSNLALIWSGSTSSPT